jgi:hypothetical protein
MLVSSLSIKKTNNNYRRYCIVDGLNIYYVFELNKEITGISHRKYLEALHEDVEFERRIEHLPVNIQTNLIKAFP